MTSKAYAIRLKSYVGRKAFAAISDVVKLLNCFIDYFGQLLFRS